MTQNFEALRLAQMIEALGWRSVDKDLRVATSQELRRQHDRIAELTQMHDHACLTVDAAKDRIAELEAQLSAIGAGGIGLEPLRKREQVSAIDEGALKAGHAALKRMGFIGADDEDALTMARGLTSAQPSRECLQQIDGCKIDLPRMREAALDAQVRGYLFKADGSQVRQVIDLLYEKTRQLAALQAAPPAQQRSSAAAQTKE